MRTDKATRESAAQFANDFKEEINGAYDYFLGEIYDANGGDETHGFGPTLEEKLEAEKRTAKYRHEWLENHAREYGYDYDI